MGWMAFGVKNHKGHLRYFLSQIKAEKIAKQYGTTVVLCFNVPKYLIEENNEHLCNQG